jgi:aminoglycoside/choline kinase family phosphotransferase
VTFTDPAPGASAPTLIVMDAPPAHEDCRPFIRVAALFGATGVRVPEVLGQDLEQGFLLLTDLGPTTYLAELERDPGRADALYGDATGALVRIQAASQPGRLPPYDRALLLREMELLPEWYIARHRRYALTQSQRASLDAAFESLLANNLAQPRVYVHRDYHSRNLMVCTPGEPGILDFQDAVEGPITYDLVSLFRDAYVEWDEERVLDWCIRYWEAARKAGLPVGADFGEFYRDFEWMGLQRHLKVLGIFARLSYRDGKNGYLGDTPLVLRYVRKTCARYGAFTPLLRLLDAVENVQAQAGYTF